MFPSRRACRIANRFRLHGKSQPRARDWMTGPCVTGPCVTGPSMTGPSMTGRSMTGASMTGPSMTDLPTCTTDILSVASLSNHATLPPTTPHRRDARFRASRPDRRRTRCPSYKRDAATGRPTQADVRSPHVRRTSCPSRVCRITPPSTDDTTSMGRPSPSEPTRSSTDKMSVVQVGGSPRSSPTQQRLHPHSSFTAEP